MQWNVAERVGRVRWLFLPLGLCALVAVGAHAAADLVGDRVLWAVDRVDAFFDWIWSAWSFTAPLVDLVGLTQRTWFARAVALIWELAADALIAIPMLGYAERDPAAEWKTARDLLRRARSPRALVRSVGAWLLGTRSAARPLLASFGAGTLVPPRPPPMLSGPVPPAQALAYGAAAVLEQTPAEVGPRLRASAQELGSDDAALLALFCGEDAAGYAVDHARSSALDDLARALPPRSQPCISRAAQAAMLGGGHSLGWPLPESVRITSPFGVPEHPLLGGMRLHTGVDLGTPLR